MALASTSTRQIDVVVNDQPVGKVDRIFSDRAIRAQRYSGVWSEKDMVFDASSLKAGKRPMTFSVPAGSMTAGVIHDYLRLELDETVH